MTTKRVLLMPRWGATAEDDWYPFVTKQLETALDIQVLDLKPTADAPAIASCVAAIGDAVGDVDKLPDTVFVGHSVGAQAMMHYLASLPPEAPNAHSLLAVAGWFTLDDPLPVDGLKDWVDAELDPARVAANTDDVYALLSDNDPYTKDHEANAQLWRDRLAADVKIIKGAEHFNGKMEAAVVNALLHVL
jgi:predicted alpha/beta hydrolase family esterase